MKLSEKGFHKVLRTCRFDEDRATYVLKYSEANKDYFFEVQGTKFESDDFTGAVILTTEEAKAIAYKLGYLMALTTQSKTEKETQELTDMLWWRIEQAEDK